MKSGTTLTVIKFSLISLGLTLSSLSIAGTITYADSPYTAGNTLSASDLNTKFNQIKSAINDNNSGIKSLTLNPYSAFLENGATAASGYGPFSGVVLPDTGSPSFSYGFVLPANYTTGDSITVNLIVHTSSMSCSIDLRPNSISVARVGQTHLVGSGASTGLNAVTSSLITAPATANQSILQQYAITAPDGTSLQARDSIIFSLYRLTTGVTNDCTGDLRIQGVYIDY